MRRIDQLLNQYGESHQNQTNKWIHWFCVPIIFFTLLGIVGLIPYPFSFQVFDNWSYIVMILVIGYYFRLSIPLALGFIIVAAVMIYANSILIQYCEFKGWNSLFIYLIVFTLAWIGQFIGHHIEGKKPSFLKDIQFLLIGPAWLLHFIYKKLGILY